MGQASAPEATGAQGLAWAFETALATVWGVREMAAAHAVPKWRPITASNSGREMAPLLPLSAAATSVEALGADGPTARLSSACGRVCRGVSGKAVAHRRQAVSA